jgi:hypothetical protein
MNVLILTPDSVGSTLLQRMLTIYMQFHNFDRPVINLHELTNGLHKYYSPEFNQEIVSKHQLEHWGYHQCLDEVVDLLSSVTHYKTSRLAHYHLVRRGDTLKQQIPFYDYLNKNFYVIACRRDNVFEHALSLTLAHVTKKLNVYNVCEKIDSFYDIYKTGIELDNKAFLNQLNAYHLYVDWSDRYFNISSYFNYEQDVPRLEEYILNLPVFSSQSNRVTWDQNFGMSFNSWNKMHYVRSDIGSVMIENAANVKQLLLKQSNIVSKYQQHAPPNWPSISSKEDFENLPAKIKNNFIEQQLNEDGLISFLDPLQQQHLSQYKEGYKKACDTITKMTQLGIIVSGPPIKKQTLNEKQKIIKNFDQLLEIYNKWASEHPEVYAQIGSVDVNDRIGNENQFWKSFQSTELISNK